MASSHTRRARLCRTGATGAAAALLLLAGAPSAAAAGIAIPLEPSALAISLYPMENFGEEDFTPVQVQWGGSVVVQLPDGVDATDLTAELLLGEEEAEEPSRIFSTEPSTEMPPPGVLVVTDLGDGELEVEMPVDANLGDSMAILVMEGLTATMTGSELADTGLAYFFELDAAFPATQTVSPAVLVDSSVPCDQYESVCDGIPVTAGDELALSVPPTSALRAAGVGNLADAEVMLLPMDDEEYFHWESVGEEQYVGGELTPELPAETAAEVPPFAAELLAGSAPVTGGAPDAGGASPAAAGVLAADAAPVTAAGHELVEPTLVATGPYAATMTLPADTEAGSHALFISEGDGTPGSRYATTVVFLEVAAAPVVAPAAPVVAMPVNAGLRSDTGWIDDEASGSWPLLATGAGMLLAAGAGGVALARTRRTSGTCAD
ncbi:hypothetical protein [Blastococcus sp. LR1]|uniref:hypothetical protein n=1 Tax=Blastococcus sp. LR1 TaxID=2877000 RepID=UPI001CC9C821|nr:hypothetical protein [Blastococcus sp. LR1]MCA0144039.1 hypothetical protein [Blastococcus sp. LR1]